MFYFKEIRKIKGTLGLSTFIAGLCCVPSMIMVLFGLSTVSAAASLSYNLYSGYVWAFRGVAFLALMAGLFYYFLQKRKYLYFGRCQKREKSNY